MAFNDYPEALYREGDSLLEPQTDKRSSGTFSRSGQSMAKRAIDIILSFSALIFVLPLMLIIGLMVKLTDGGPMLFAQRRIGRDGKEFYCLKFRTMVTDAQKRLDDLLAKDPVAAREWNTERKLTNDPRITPFGAFLRKSSLDELPQLINILKGEMSIVGPRPIQRAEAVKYGDKFDFYLSTRPGLTGLWQVSGRSDTSYDERVNMDVRYVTDWSVSNDIKIIAMTVPAILASRGAR
ncbi:sugar transferase [Henriciella aquimarina]|uniref:sugar transferase n=1 Tax=Henriciella aquimarina TaxID=545261 RepID=UPI001F1DA263|nr:sugar transferase [Henriciella aquimarina]